MVFGTEEISYPWEFSVAFSVRTEITRGKSDPASLCSQVSMYMRTYAKAHAQDSLMTHGYIRIRNVSLSEYIPCTARYIGAVGGL